MKVIAIEIPNDSWGHEAIRQNAMSGGIPDFFYHLLGYFKFKKDVHCTVLLPDPDAGRVYVTYDENMNKSSAKWSVLCTAEGLQIEDTITKKVHKLLEGQEIKKDKRYCLLISG